MVHHLVQCSLLGQEEKLSGEWDGGGAGPNRVLSFKTQSQFLPERIENQTGKVQSFLTFQFPNMVWWFAFSDQLAQYGTFEV